MKKQKEMTALSASRLSTLKGCTWEYYCKYHLKLPDRNNLGAMMGSVCHEIFELLGDPQHKPEYDKVIAAQNLEASTLCDDLIKKELTKYGVFTPENYKQVKSMTLNGLNYDFFAQRFVDAYGGPDLEKSEEPFDIIKETTSVRYRVKGFIDKLWLFKQRTAALIRDFKSSKKKYNISEMEENMQNLMYTLAVKHLYPETVKRHVEFLFLQFKLPEDGKLVGHILDDAELDGFELFLTEVQKVVDSFDEEYALSDTAKDKGYVTDGSFGGMIKCGKARFAGELKKDGNKMWHCPFKFAFDYYVLVDKEGKIVDRAFEDEVERLFDKEEEGFKILKKQYLGCPAWGNKITKSS